MLRLKLNAQPEWLTLMPGVRVLLRPMSSAIFIRAQVSPEVIAAEDRIDRSVAFTKAIAAAAIVEWQGVFDADSDADDPPQPLPVTPEAVSALLDIRAAYDAISDGYTLPWLVVSEEKNGSAPSSNGTSAAAQTIAVPATVSAPSARA